MRRSTVLRVSIVGALCALVGAAAGIAGSSASSSPARHLQIAPGRHGFFFRGGPLADASGPPVHSDAVVPKQGGGFMTLTMDRGRFSSVSADQLTITEGTKTDTYKTVTLTIPSGATIRRNGAQAQLSELRSGDEVSVLQSPKTTVVIAHDAKHQLQFRPGLLRRRALPPSRHGLMAPTPPPPGAGPEVAPGA